MTGAQQAEQGHAGSINALIKLMSSNYLKSCPTRTFACLDVEAASSNVSEAWQQHQAPSTYMIKSKVAP